PPYLPKRLSPILAGQRDEPVLRERDGPISRRAAQQREQSRQVREVPGDQHVAVLAAQSVAHPRGRAVGLQISRRGGLRQGIARAPERLGGRPRPQFAAVPHEGGARAARRRLSRQPRHVRRADRRERPPRIDLGADGVAVMDQEEVHGAFYSRRKATAEVAKIAENTTHMARHGRWVLAATILGSSLTFIDATVVNVALPALQVDLRATMTDVQWVIEAYALFLGALILVGGSLGDQFGRKRVFLSGVVVFTAGSIACGVAPAASALVAARAVQGIGAAFLVPGSLAIISATFDEGERG